NVEADGVVNACDVIHQRELDLGSMHRHDVKSCYHSDTAELIRRRHDGLYMCKTCTWLGNCGGTCLGRSTLGTLDEFGCRYSQLIFPYLMKELVESDYLVSYYERHGGIAA